MVCIADPTFSEVALRSPMNPGLSMVVSYYYYYYSTVPLKVQY